MKIAIKPVPSFPHTATQLECIATTVELGVGLSTGWRLLDSGNQIVSALGIASLTAEQYEGWTGDDDYVCECVASNLGLALA